MAHHRGKIVKRDSTSVDDTDTMRRSVTFLLIIVISSLCSVPTAQSQIADPILRNASFDSSGRLMVSTNFSAYEGCYVTVKGGLSPNKIDTAIISKQLTQAAAEKGAISIRTVRRYFCKRRTLYVNIELVCLGDVIGSALSKTKAVPVPASNYSSR